MKSELSTLRKELEAHKDMIGLIGTELNVREGEGNSMAAGIETDWSAIEISFGKGLDLVPDEETRRYAKKKNVTHAKTKAGFDVLEHEAGHRENRVGENRGCPYDLETHERIKDAVTRGLETIGKKGLEHYVTNAFEDVFDNVNCRRHTDFAGQTLFWNNQGIVNGKNGKFNPFYEAFVRLNLLLGGNVADYQLLQRFFTNKSEVKEAVNSFLNSVKKVTREKYSVRLHNKTGFSRLFDFDDLDERARVWAELGKDFALYFGKLLDKVPEQRMFGSGEGDENSEDQNPLDKEMKIPTNRQKIAMDRYKRGEGPASHRKVEEQLYDFYKAISKEIPVETSDYFSSQSMPLVKFGRRFVREDEQKIRFRGVGIKTDGTFGLKTTKHTQEHPTDYKRHVRKFPKLKVAMFDRSGSMGLSPQNDENVGSKEFIPWGDRSKYHFALKGKFGIDNFFERQGIAPYIEDYVLGFSGEEPIRGESAIVSRQLLTEPSGGTSLDVQGLERELDEEALVLSISDGELKISDKEKKRFEKKIEKCDYAHIQIGEETDFSKYLRSLGIPVIPVRGDDDLSKAMISFVSSYYRTIPKIGGEK